NAKNNEKGLISGMFDSVFYKDSKVKPEQYRVQVRQDQDGNQAQVNVLNKDGAAENSKTAARILALLHEQLK
ncbi:MAG TPA: hypothetical protein VNH80_10990, partial [Burkholderiales bacterium]|nr:hypothetical protein [Burkholderiales bacterium]